MGSASAKPEVSPIEGNFKVVEEVDEKSSKVSEIVVETKDVNTHTTDEVDAVSPRMEEGEQSEETLEEVVEPRIIPQQVHLYLIFNNDK